MSVRSLWTRGLVLILFLKDIFKFDPDYLANEERYKAIKAEILGEDSDEESGSEEEDDSDEDDEGLYSTVYPLRQAAD